MYVELTIEEAIKRCNKNAKVLVAVQDLESEDTNTVFVIKKREEYSSIFSDVQTVATILSVPDEFIKQLRCFTEKQSIPDIKPMGYEKIILLQK